MSTESLVLHYSDDTLLVRPRASLDSVSAPFLAEEAYPRILAALLDTHLGNGDDDRICLSEENIAAVASAASSALFGEDDVFARFLVVPRVESAISVLLWRVRINSTCAGTITEGQTGIQLPSVPVRVLASSLAGLLDNTKLYASSKQVAFPAPHTPLQKHEPRLDHHHHLAPPTPLTATARTHSDPGLSPARLPPPRLSFSRPMTPPDSAVVEVTPISASDASTADTFLTPTTPTSKRSGVPRVKFRPPPIITRTTPGRPVPRLTQSTGAVTLTFAAAALSGCEIEPLPYIPKTKEQDQEQPTTDNVAEPEKPDEKTPEDPPPSPPPTAKPKTNRPPSPNPPRAPSPTKRVLRKAPPTPKSRPRSIVRSPSPTKQSMWAPAGAEAHYRSSSPTRLAPPVRPKSLVGSRNGSMESSPALSKNLDLPSSSTSSPALIPKSKLRASSPVPRTPSPVPPPALVEDACSPSPSQSMPGSSLRSPSSNLLRSPASMLNASSVGFGSPSGSMLDMRDKPPVTPSTPRRTVSVSGVKFEVIESPLPSRHASWSVHQPSTPSRTPPAQDTLSPSPNALRTRLGASPGATSLSTVPSLSPFPDSDSEGEFGTKKDKNSDEDVTVTSKIRGLGLMRAVTPPTRASTSTPTRKSPPPINTNTSSPSRNSKRSYTVGVPMTQMSSHPPVNASESEAESLAFPGSTSTLSLPGDISLPELVSPFTTPLELGPSSSSGGEGDGSPTRTRFGDGPLMGARLGAGANLVPGAGTSASATPVLAAGIGGKREPLPLPKGAGPVVNSGAGPVSGSSSMTSSRLGTSFVSEPLSSQVLASVVRSRSTHSRHGSVHNEQPVDPVPLPPVPRSHSRAGSVPPTHSRSTSTHSRSESIPRPAHTRSESGHSRSGSQAHVRFGGRESEMDLLVPFAGAERLSRADVLRLMTRTGSSSSVGSSSPARTSVAGTPVPVFMSPESAPPSQVGKRISLARSPPSTSSESTNVEPLSHARIPSEASDETDESMACTTEVGVGAGRARIQSGVGIGGGRTRGGKRAKKGESPTKPKVESPPRAMLDSALARSSSVVTARPRFDSTRTRTESMTRPRVDSAVRTRVESVTRPRAESTPRPRVESVTRPRVDSNVRARVDSGLRRKSGANDSPVSPASQGSASRSPSSASGRRAVGRKPSGEALGRRTPIGRKASATSMRKSSTSSLRSTTTTTTRTTPVTVSTKKTSVSSVSGTSTPRSGASTPRSRTMSTGTKENANGISTPKLSGTPRPSLSTPRTSMSSGRNVGSPRPSLTIPRPTTTSPRSSPRTPVATTPTNKTPIARVPPARPQRSSLRPGPRANTLSTSAPAVTQNALASTEDELAPLTAPAVSAPSLVHRATSPPRTRATSLDTSPSKNQLGAEDARPRRVTSVSSKPPPLSRSSASTLAPPPVPPPIRARASSRTTSTVSHEDGGVPFPIPESASESEGGLKVPSTPKPIKRSLSVSSAARRLVGRARGASPVPSMPTPATDAVSLAPSTTASTMEKTPDQQEKVPKSGRSLSRLAFSALLPKRNVNNAAAEAKAALAQAKAREVAEAKAKAKAAAEEAKARAKAESEAKAAAKEPRRLARRFGSMSKKSAVAS
ncbi:proteophosphoglycan 5 [Ceratobasidium sp. AG-Ba]|nr:proteophosphoglycan 5 [Ceratobasidium sp. AG-Ba]